MLEGVGRLLELRATVTAEDQRERLALAPKRLAETSFTGSGLAPGRRIRNVSPTSGR